MSKIKRHLEDWLIDNQINGDDGTGFEDYKTEEEEKWKQHLQFVAITLSQLLSVIVLITYKS